jgi:catechol 2,3-dioxygenase-like lactoylglutathione lyase family enzyme
MNANVGVGLFIEDIKKMVLFYRDIMGFETDWEGGSFGRSGYGAEREYIELKR